MNTRIWILAFAFAPLCAGAARASEPIEVPVEALLAPPVGYDDNDNVQVVLHGALRNGCYRLAEYTVERAEGSRKIRVRQYAIRLDEGACADESNLPEHMKMTVPFTQEASLGRLEPGDYEIDYLGADGQGQSRKLNVGRAIAPTVDSLPYASVSAIATQDVFNGWQSVTAELRGTLTSTCTELTDDVRIQKEDDVLVILPVLHRKPGDCTEILVPFKKDVDLGKLAPGHYLIHVRSMSGRSVNHVIEVRK